MKALLIADDATELLYLYHDDEFKKHVSKKLLTEATPEIPFAACLQNFLSPIVLSCVTLKVKLNLPCSNIECSDQVIVFKQFDGLLYIGIQATNSTVYSMEVELQYLHCLVGMLYGPAYHYQLNPNSITQKQRAWTNVSLVLESYLNLCLNERAFLFEAVEQLKVNSKVSEVCGRTIHKCMEKLNKSSKKDNIQYGLIFVDTKILAYQLSSTRQDELTTKNLLQIISLISSKSPSVDKSPEVIFSDDETATDYFPEMDCSPLNGVFSTDEEFKSCNSDPGESSSTVSFNFNNVEYLESDSNSQTTQSNSEEASLSHTLEKENHIEPHNDHFSSDIDGNLEDLVTYRIPIFLASNRSPFIPYILYCVPLSKCIKMVFLSKRKNAEFSDILCGMRYLLRKIKFQDNMLVVEGRENTVSKLETCCRNLQTYTKKLNGKQQLIGRKILESWKANGQKQLQIFLTTDSTDNSTLLERCVMETQRSLFLFFKTLFPSAAEEKIFRTPCGFHEIQKYTNSKLSGYLDYLLLKSQLSIATYKIFKYPGLIQFALVRRIRKMSSIVDESKSLLADEVICPFVEGFNSEATSVTLLVSLFYKQVQNSFSELCEGNLSTKVESGDFLYSSNVWFSYTDTLEYDDKSLVNAKTVKTTDNMKCASLFSGNVYRRLLGSLKMSGSILTVFHLHCMHFSVVPSDVIEQQQNDIVRSACSQFA
uniref:Hermansky-Pudlak syndrome 1 protein homolog n=1 Tax=Phallusia mammillata TaxID=59560 RepID=A0A6F9DE03_9ASCI|nr:Hermansky-Pudlak syndrome 1 protein homolog [Phallusia mammillata]